MMAITDKPPANRPGGETKRRLLWFVALWAAGVGTVALVSLLLRAWIAP
jgi:hypothetical protein